MPRIDAHQHFWQFDPVRDSWITPEMEAIRRDFGPADLEPLLRQHHFDGCVAVQSEQSEAHNDFLLALAGGHPFVRGIVGWVDLQAHNVRDRLAHYRQFPLVKGFRHVLQGEPDRALMLQPRFRQGIAALGEWGYTYDLLIYPDQLQYVPELVKAFPDQRFVIDHLAKPLIKAGAIAQWKKEMVAVAEFGNVYCKVSGMVTEADWHDWKYDDFAPYLDVVVEAFSPRRIMFGSDWPVCLVAASYDRMLQVVTGYFASFSEEQQNDVFGHTAAAFYQL